MQNGSFLCWISWCTHSHSPFPHFYLLVITCYKYQSYPNHTSDVLDLLQHAETVPLRTVNRQCSSGLQAVADVVAAIKAGFYDIGKISCSLGSFYCLLCFDLIMW